MRILLVALALFIVIATGDAAFTPFEVKYPQMPEINSQHERTVPPAGGDLNSPCFVWWSRGC